MTFRSLFLLGAMVVATGAAAQTQPRTKAKVGVNTKNPTENLHVNGTLRVQKLPADGSANAISNQKRMARDLPMWTNVSMHSMW